MLLHIRQDLLSLWDEKLGSHSYFTPAEQLTKNILVRVRKCDWSPCGRTPHSLLLRGPLLVRYNSSWDPQYLNHKLQPTTEQLPLSEKSDRHLDALHTPHNVHWKIFFLFLPSVDVTQRQKRCVCHLEAHAVRGGVGDCLPLSWPLCFLLSSFIYLL